MAEHHPIFNSVVRDYKTPEDHRIYAVCEEGKLEFKYPSVTTVCKVGDKGPQLAAWKKRVGEAEAERLRNRGAARGQALHTAVEHYLAGVSMDEDLSNPNTKSNFTTIKSYLDKWVDDIYCFETPVWSHELETAGRIDLFAHWCGVPALIDIKSTTKRRDEKYYEMYKLQCSAYCRMLTEMTHRDIREFVLLFATEEGEAFTIRGHIDDHIDKFISLRHKYREIYGK